MLPTLTAFRQKLWMPFGFLVESVSIRKASVALAGGLSGLLGTGWNIRGRLRR